MGLRGRRDTQRETEERGEREGGKRNRKERGENLKEGGEMGGGEGCREGRALKAECRKRGSKGERVRELKDEQKEDDKLKGDPQEGGT